MILHAETNLVEADVTVRDANGHTIPGLQASDFEVLDNGIPQKIDAFSILRSEGNASSSEPSPRVSTFFIDDLHPGLLPFVKQAARQFAAKYLRPRDRISIATASGAGGIDFTDNEQQFIFAANRLNVHAPRTQSLEEYEAQSLATLYALRDTVKRLSELPGERTLVWLSAGFVIHIQLPHDVPHDVQRDVDNVIDSAVHSNVVIDAIDAKGLTPSATEALNRPLREISLSSGGHLFEHTNDLLGAMELAAHPEVTYLLAFNPGARDGKFHALKIRFKSKRADSSLEFRPGYLSRKDDDSQKKLDARKPMDEAVFSKQTLHDVAAVALAGGSPKDGAVPLSIDITLDVNQLQFKAANGRHVQQIVFLMTLLDAHDNFVTGKESIMDLALTDQKLASLEKDGLKVVATLNATAGIYQVRTVVREGMKGNLSASTTAVQLRAK
jgi:VWFA-related protein